MRLGWFATSTWSELCSAPVTQEAPRPGEERVAGQHRAEGASEENTGLPVCLWRCAREAVWPEWLALVLGACAGSEPQSCLGQRWEPSSTVAGPTLLGAVCQGSRPYEESARVQAICTLWRNHPGTQKVLHPRKLNLLIPFLCELLRFPCVIPSVSRASCHQVSASPGLPAVRRQHVAESWAGTVSVSP